MPPDDEVHVDPTRTWSFTSKSTRQVARGGPWSRGVTNTVGALIVPDASCGVRVFERVDDMETVVERGCVAGLIGARPILLAYNRNVSGLCAVRDDAQLLVGRFDVSTATLVTRAMVRATDGACDVGDQWGAALFREANGARGVLFFDEEFRVGERAFALPHEPGELRPVALVNHSDRWDALWLIDDGRELLYERYVPQGPRRPLTLVPSRIDSVARASVLRWNAAQRNAVRAHVLGDFAMGNGLFVLTRTEAREGVWLDGVLFCTGAAVHTRRLYNGTVLDAMLLPFNTDWVLLTLHRDGDEQVLRATWVSSTFSTRGPSDELLRAPGLTLLGADIISPHVETILVWYAVPFEGRSELRLSSFVSGR